MSAVLAAAGGWRYARASAPLNGPIIVVSIDTLRADHLPAYGYAKINTPAIDLLASNGVVFERAYSHAPDTLAAHVALLSGRLPFETGVRGSSGGRVRAGERLLSQMLRERGYATAGIISSSVLGRESGIALGNAVRGGRGNGASGGWGSQQGPEGTVRRGDEGVQIGAARHGVRV